MAEHYRTARIGHHLPEGIHRARNRCVTLPGTLSLHLHRPL